MQSSPPRPTQQLTHRIELKLRDVGQLFNTMDPSPFHEKDLDHDAEEFIESWAQEFPVNEPLSLWLHLDEFPPDGNPQPMVTQAIHNFFGYRARMNHLEFRQLMQEGRRCLLVGLIFLIACLFVSEMVAGYSAGTMSDILRESLTIGGWVAMWRPLEIYLYEWWPVKQRGKILLKLSRVPVTVNRNSPQPEGRAEDETANFDKHPDTFAGNA